MDVLTGIVSSLNNILWDKNILLVLLVGTGIWYTFQLGFIQIRGFGEGFRRTFGGLFKKGESADSNGMSSFQSLATAIAAQVGTGNLAGAATAIAVGGPGAIFWMWVSAFFGMATIYAEAVMAQKYKTLDGNNTVTGGPVYYIKAAFKGNFGKFLAASFAVFIVLALGFMGNAVQSNSIADAFNRAFGINPIIIGIILAILSYLVFSGGMSRIAKVTELIVPIMALFYIVGSLIVILVNYQNIPLAFYEIIVGAFNPQAIAGGVIGATIKTAMVKGVARGLFSNEAGMGSTPHAHAQANVAHPHDQGIVAIAGVFIDTCVVLTLNALVIISTLYTADGPLHECGAAAASTVITKANLAQLAFGSVLGKGFGAAFVAICLFFFAFSTILGWNMFAKVNVIYLFGEKNAKLTTTIYTVIALVFIFLGTLMSNDLVWELTDAFNYLMVIPNAIALFALTKVVQKSLKEADDMNK